MLSVVVPFRNTRRQASNLLASLAETFRSLQCLGEVEFIFTDDASDADTDIVGLLRQFRDGIGAAVSIVRFKERQHYTRACAYSFSRAKGERILLVSHDMILTPACVQMLLNVAGLDARFGIVRATSPYVDCFPQHQVGLPLPARGLRDLFAFARYVAEYYGLQWVEDRLLTGDVMLIQRSVLDKIGVMDPRYFGYFGDIDFGLRAQRAGFLLVCAKGAWLLHEGAGYYADEATRTGQDPKAVHAARMQVVDAAYRLFRDKWDPGLAAAYRGVAEIDFERLRALPQVKFDLYQPPLELPAAVGEMI